MTRFTPKVRRLVIDYATYVVVREVNALFQDNGIMPDSTARFPDESSVRRSTARAHLASLDPESEEDDRKLLRVYADLWQEISQGDDSANPAVNNALRDRWERVLKGAGFNLDQKAGTIDFCADPDQREFSPESLAALRDPEAILNHLRRIEAGIETDPRLVISASKAIIETTAKAVLRARNVTMSGKETMPTLICRAVESLGLDAKGTDDGSLKRIFGPLSSMPLAISEIRNKVGVDHGSEEVPRWVRPRHARLIYNSAYGWCHFMLDTLNDPDAPWRSEMDLQTAQHP